MIIIINVINVNDSLIHLKVNSAYCKKKKTVLIVKDSMLNGIEESKLSKTRHI